MNAITDVRTVHSRAYTAWKELNALRETYRAGVDAWMDKEFARYGLFMSQWPQHNKNRNREFYRNTFPVWTDEQQAIMDDLETVVLALDKYARPGKRMKP